MATIGTRASMFRKMERISSGRSTQEMKTHNMWSWHSQEESQTSSKVGYNKAVQARAKTHQNNAHLLVPTGKIGMCDKFTRQPSTCTCV